MNNSTIGPRQKLIDDKGLFTQISTQQTLLAAWRKVWLNSGSAGGDHVSLEAFSMTATQRIARLSRDLRRGDYAPKPIRYCEIPKKNGGKRPLHIPSIIDRVAQTAVAQTLMPHFDAEFEPSSYAYRPGRSVGDAVTAVARFREAGYTHVVDADINRFFEEIPHDLLMLRWGQSVTPGPLTELVSTWLTHAFPTGRGIAQGSPLSPLLANLYLDRLDEAFSGRGTRLVRFADDFVILCGTEASAKAARTRVGRLLAEYGLSLNMRKTRVLDYNSSLHFLGNLFVRSMVMTSKLETERTETARWLRQIAQRDVNERDEVQALRAREALQETRGFSPGFRVLYVMTPDRRVSLRNQSFTVEEGNATRPDEEPIWRELLAIPHRDVDRIEIGPRGSITDIARDHALATDTVIAEVDGFGRTKGITASNFAPRAARHMAQARHVLDNSRRIDLARIIVDGRIRNQRALLRRLIRNHKPGKTVTDGLQTLNRILRKLSGAEIDNGDVSVLLGHEGAAAAAFWPALGKLFRVTGFGLERRVRAPADNPTNIILNFFCSLLERDIGMAIGRAGLHPGFGVLHTAQDHHDACLYDLMEEFRAHLTEGLAVYCVNKHIVKNEMFEQLSGGWHMSALAQRALIRAYEQRIDRLVKSPRSGHRVTWRKLMIEQAFALAAHFEDGRIYEPYIMDY